jgi:hypothetical protein
MRQLLFAAAVLACAAPTLGAVTEVYAKRAKEWRDQHKRADFFREFNKEHDPPVTGPRADRLWNYLNEQFDHGAVVFKDNGIAYALPITHYIPLPDFFIDLIELGLKPLRKVYYFVMDLIHEEAHELHHNLVEHLNEKGIMQVLLGLCGAYLAFSLFSWFINRFTDGIWPAERKANKETKRLAREYMAKKRE